MSFCPATFSAQPVSRDEFPGQMRYVIPPVSSGTMGTPPSLTYWENLQRTALRRDLHQMPGPPQLTFFGAKEQQLYSIHMSELLTHKVKSSHPILWPHLGLLCKLEFWPHSSARWKRHPQGYYNSSWGEHTRVYLNSRHPIHNSYSSLDPIGEPTNTLADCHRATLVQLVKSVKSSASDDRC